MVKSIKKLFGFGGEFPMKGFLAPDVNRQVITQP